MDNLIYDVGTNNGGRHCLLSVTRFSRRFDWAGFASDIDAIFALKAATQCYQTPEIFHGVADLVGDSLAGGPGDEDRGRRKKVARGAGRPLPSTREVKFSILAGRKVRVRCHHSLPGDIVYSGPHSSAARSSCQNGLMPPTQGRLTLDSTNSTLAGPA